MTYLPRNDVQEIWDNTKDKSWSGLERTLEGRIIKESIGNNTSTMVINMAEDMYYSGEPFPKNVDELHNLINENAGAEGRE